MPKRKISTGDVDTADVLKKQGRLTKDDIAVAALAYLTVSERGKKLDKEKTGLKGVLTTYLEKFSDEEKPHDTYGTVITYGGHKIELRMVARSRTQPKVNYDAVIKKKFKKYASILIVNEPVFDTQALLNLVTEGKITEAEAKEIVDVVTTFAFTPKLIA